jgi:hypothetical protein
MAHLTHSNSTKAGWINAVLIPVKQHLVCCGLVPMAGSLLGGGVAGALESNTGEIIMATLIPPVVTYGVMWAEQKINHRRHTSSCECDHPKTLTRKNYFRQTALAYGFYVAAHFLLPHHHHDNIDKPPASLEKKRHATIIP